MLYIEIIKLLLPIVTALSLGAYCKKVKIVDDQAIEKIKMLLFNIVLPALLFNSFLFASYSKKSFLYIAVVYIGMLAAFLVAKKVKKFFIKEYRDYFPELMTTWEGGTLGITLCSLLFGHFGLEQMAIFDFGCTFMAYSIIVPGFYAKDGKKIKVTEILKMIFSTVLFDAIVLGGVLGYIGVGRIISEHVVIDAIYHGIIDIIMAPAYFLIMFYVGYKINISKNMITPLLTICAYRLFFSVFSCVISSLILFLFIPFDKKVLTILMIAYSLPPSYSLGLLTDFGGKKHMQELYSDMASFMVIITLIVYTILAIYSLY